MKTCLISAVQAKKVTEIETCFNYCDPDKGFFSSDERKWITRIRKLKEQYPDDIKVIAEPETNDGCIYVKLPPTWLKVIPPKKRDLTEDQKNELRERMKKAQLARQNKKNIQASSEHE